MLPEDTVMLASFLNLKLRDQYSSPDEMFEELDVSKAEITERLAKGGFKYDEATNSFR